MNSRAFLARLKSNRRFARVSRAVADDRGVAAVEFALILPLMVTMFFGMDALNQRLIAVHRIELAATSLANLTASKRFGGDAIGQAAMTASDVTNLFKAAGALIYPLPSSGLHIDVYQVWVKTSKDGSGAITNFAAAVWKADQNGLNPFRCNGAAQLTAPDDIPSDLVPTNGSMLGDKYYAVVQVAYDYNPAFGYGLFNWRGSATSIVRKGYAENRNMFTPALIQNKAGAQNCWLNAPGLHAG